MQFSFRRGWRRGRYTTLHGVLFLLEDRLEHISTATALVDFPLLIHHISKGIKLLGGTIFLNWIRTLTETFGCTTSDTEVILCLWYKFVFSVSDREGVSGARWRLELLLEEIWWIDLEFIGCEAFKLNRNFLGLGKDNWSDYWCRRFFAALFYLVGADRVSERYHFTFDTLLFSCCTTTLAFFVWFLLLKLTYLNIARCLSLLHSATMCIKSVGQVRLIFGRRWIAKNRVKLFDRGRHESAF